MRTVFVFIFQFITGGTSANKKMLSEQLQNSDKKITSVLILDELVQPFLLQRSGVGFPW